MININHLKKISLFVFMLMAGLSLYAWNILPADSMIPIHWNIDGEIDRLMDKTYGLMIMPLVTILVSMIFAYLPKFEPRRANLEQSQGLFAVSWIMVLLVIAVAHSSSILTALGYNFPVMDAVFLAISLTLIMIGNFLGKSKSMFFIGLRTPWTLSSEKSWLKSNRLFGKLMVLIGLASIIGYSMGFDGLVSLKIMLVSLIAAMAISLVYSYIVWRQDQNKNPTL